MTALAASTTGPTNDSSSVGTGEFHQKTMVATPASNKPTGSVIVSGGTRRIHPSLVYKANIWTYRDPKIHGNIYALGAR